MQDDRMADDVRQALHGNMAVDDMIRGQGWRTRDNTEGGGDDNDDNDDDQSLRWQRRCNDDDMYQSFLLGGPAQKK